MNDNLLNLAISSASVPAIFQSAIILIWNLEDLTQKQTNNWNVVTNCLLGNCQPPATMSNILLNTQQNYFLPFKYIFGEWVGRI